MVFREYSFSAAEFLISSCTTQRSRVRTAARALTAYTDPSKKQHARICFAADFFADTNQAKHIKQTQHALGWPP